MNADDPLATIRPIYDAGGELRWLEARQDRDGSLILINAIAIVHVAPSEAYPDAVTDICLGGDDDVWIACPYAGVRAALLGERAFGDWERHRR